jgi:CubicO group peptidase (beta-lactamase class C family)
VRTDSTVDPYLTTLTEHVDPRLLISGIGEQPAIIHLRDFKLGGFTSGCVCVAPKLSHQMLAALRKRDYSEAEQLPRLAKTYKKDGDKLVETPIAYLGGRSPADTNRYPLANGGLFSTAEDYAKFLRMVLNKGELNGKRYLSEKAVGDMTGTHTPDAMKAGFVPGSAWGLTWSLVREPQGVTASLSPMSHGHGGAYGTQGWIDPQRGIVYVLMIQRSDFKNQGGSDGSPVRQAFHDSVVAALKK